MIQELLGSGGGNAPLGERKISIPFPCLPSSTTPVFTANSTPTSTTKPVNPSNSSSAGNNNSSSSNINNNNNNPENINANHNNLRCPRCDSTNTKFCYYNNYNLTQPRHFCKTCRRYWTKGGTLRNVPIGGGCRKNKTTVTSSSATSSGISMSKSSSNAAMAKAAKSATFSTEMLLNGGSPGFLGPLDHLHPHPHLYPEFQTLIPPLWPSIPQGQSSHILALLRGANPNPNPNHNPNPIFTHLKAEGSSTLGLDPYGAGPPSVLGSFLRAGNPHPMNGFGLGAQDVVQNSSSNILELYQRLKSSANYNYCGIENPGSVVLGNVMGSSSSSAMNSSILEGSSGATDNLGGYNLMTSPGINSSWSDLPTVHINGAFP